MSDSKKTNRKDINSDILSLGYNYFQLLTLFLKLHGLYSAIRGQTLNWGTMRCGLMRRKPRLTPLNST